MHKIFFCSFSSLWILSVLASESGQEPLMYGSVPSTAAWDNLNSTVGGRLFDGVPFAQPCYTNGFDSPECLFVRSNYLDEGMIVVNRLWVTTLTN